MSALDSRISVIIPTFDKVERLRIVLGAFVMQTLSPRDFELVVVVDGSKDTTVDFLSSFTPPFPLRCVQQPNQGRSQARNSGIEVSRYPILVFCDDDTIPQPHYLEAHQKAHLADGRRAIHGRIYSLPYLRFFRDPATGELCEGQPIDSELGTLRRLLLEGPPETVLAQCERQKKLSLLERQIQTILVDERHPMRWLGFTGGNVSIRREVLAEVGTFDTRFGLLWGGEDLELGYRAVKKGVQVEYSRDASCYHINHYRATFQEQLESSVALFYAKHNDPHIKHLARLLLGDIRDLTEYLMCVARELPSISSDSTAQLHR